MGGRARGQTPGPAPAAGRTLPRVVLPLAMAAASFLFVVFVGGGLLVGALGLRTLSQQQAVIVPMPAPVREALDSIAGVARPDSSEPRLAMLFAALPDWDGTEPFNILLLGIDQRDDEREEGTNPGRTDTMMMLRIDPRAKSAGLISFPRDLWVDIPTVGQGRIDSAFTYGEVRQRGGGGPALARRTVEQNFGLRVDYYALVNFHGLEQIVDTVGGIVVDVERPLKDNEYPTDDYGVERVYIPPGLQFMDGRLALKYARSRHTDNDFGRMRRQQRVLSPCASARCRPACCCAADAGRPGPRPGDHRSRRGPARAAGEAGAAGGPEPHPEHGDRRVDGAGSGPAGGAVRAAVGQGPYSPRHRGADRRPQPRAGRAHRGPERDRAGGAAADAAKLLLSSSATT